MSRWILGWSLAQIWSLLSQWKACESHTKVIDQGLWVLDIQGGFDPDFE